MMLGMPDEQQLVYLEADGTFAALTLSGQDPHCPGSLQRVVDSNSGVKDTPFKVFSALGPSTAILMAEREKLFKEERFERWASVKGLS